MPYILYETSIIPLTKSKKEKNVEPTYTVDRVGSVESRDQANAWVNKDEEHRSWSFRD